MPHLITQLNSIRAAFIDPDELEFDSLLQIFVDAGCLPRAGTLWGHATALCPVHRVRTLKIWFEPIAPVRAPKRRVIRWRNAVLTCSLGCDDVALRNVLGLSLMDVLPSRFREAA